MADSKAYARIEITGLKELDDRLRKIGSLAQKEAAIAMARAMASVIAKEARKKVQHKSGRLKKDIRIFRQKNLALGQFRYFVGTGKKGWYGRLVEFGTTPHVIKARRAKALGKDGRLGSVVNHPGAKPYPWLRPAFDENYARALEAGRRKYERVVEQKEKASAGGE